MRAVECAEAKVDDADAMRAGIIAGQNGTAFYVRQLREARHGRSP